MRKLLLSAAALRDFDDIFEYLTSELCDSVRARTIVDRIGDQCEKLASLPSVLGRPRPDLAPGLRSFPFRGYAIFMRYGEDTLEIVNILHSRRDPDAIMGENEH